MSMEQFSRMKPFKGKVARVEKIPYQPDYHVRTIAGPDYRVTIVRSNSSVIIIKRIHTTLPLKAVQLEKLVDKQECTLPDEIVQCEDYIYRERK